MIFRRIGRSYHQPLMRRFLDQQVGVETRGAFENWIGPLKKLPVAGEEVVVVEMLAQPGRAAVVAAPRSPFTRRGESPWIGDDMRHPAAGVVILMRSFSP